PGGSGVATTGGPQTVSTQGGDQFVIGSSTDNVGHQTVQAFGGIDIDLTPPEASVAFDPPSPDVVVRGTGRGRSRIAGDPVAPTVVAGNGSAQTRTYTLEDGAGNTLALVLQAKPGGGALQVNVTSTSYDGAAPTPAPFTSLAYDWNLNKDGSLKSLD